ncbi:hypothetical protein T4C_2668 [Trichinella pseudospiralis]|uniref:Uncharacterized protein n=1 Tax=Trichinella pseudospiralis TaxID=6337 RepID=A0A0V1JR10_TRIPS|nr:hypothetical protein T4C_2668 [Trichinella pseudospiralis]
MTDVTKQNKRRKRYQILWYIRCKLDILACKAVLVVHYVEMRPFLNFEISNSDNAKACFD